MSLAAAVLKSPVGPLLGLVDAEGRVVRIEFAKGRTGERMLADLEAEGVDFEVAPERLAALGRQLEEYFSGERESFELELAPEGTPFQQQVWDQLRRIPFGETRSYGSIAASIGRPAASRAVGAANGANPISIVVPCHRVIGANGTLTGFGGGLPAKTLLLELEARVAGRQLALDLGSG